MNPEQSGNTERLTHAKKLIQGARFDAAIRSYQAALSIKPDFTNIHNSLGIAFLRSGLKWYPKTGQVVKL